MTYCCIKNKGISMTFSDKDFYENQIHKAESLQPEDTGLSAEEREMIANANYPTTDPYALAITEIMEDVECKDCKDCECNKEVSGDPPSKKEQDILNTVIFVDKNQAVISLKDIIDVSSATIDTATPLDALFEDKHACAKIILSIVQLIKD